MKRIKSVISKSSVFGRRRNTASIGIWPLLSPLKQELAMNIFEGSDIYAACRLSRNQYARLASQLTSHDDLLNVTAGEVFNQGILGWPTDIFKEQEYSLTEGHPDMVMSAPASICTAARAVSRKEPV
jgi:hypothetical protein